MLKKLRIQSLTPLTLFLFATSIYQPVSAEVNGDCHQFRTQTQGGWGSSAAGNNPGAYRDAHFDAAFPEGIALGCDYTLSFTSAAAVQAFLPSGGSASALTANMTDPTSYGNVLAGQLLALTLSVGFDAHDPQFSPSATLLSAQVIASGPLAGYTVAQLLEEANKAIGGCNAAFSLQELNTALTAVNENYVDGTSIGSFLNCPEVDAECSIELVAISAQCSDDGNYDVSLTLTGSAGGFEVVAPGAISISSPVFCAGDGQIAEVVLSFAGGSDYSFNVVPSAAGDCPEAGCALPEVAGTAPDCCALELECPDAPSGPFSCIDDIPAANPSAITVGDQCGEVNITVSESASGTGCQGNPYQLIRTYTATDGSNMATCVHSFEAVSLSPPVITCPPDQYASCDAAILPDVQATAESDCGGPVQIAYSDGPVSNCSQFTRTWVAIDACGYTAQCTQTVFVEDDTPPTLQAPADAIVDCTSGVSPFQTGFASASDICSAVSITYTDGPEVGGDCSTQFVRTWIATDDCGNEATADQTITKTDMTGPAIFNVPENQQIQCGEIPPPADATAVDACSGDSVEVTLTETIFDNGCRTTVLRVYTATDDCGNTTEVSRSIEIEDTEGPDMTCPADVMLQCGDEDIDPVLLGMAEAFDNCSGSDVVVSYEDSERDDNACPPVVMRVWTAADTCGNVSSCTQRIMWDDQTPPVITCAGDLTVYCSETGLHPDEIGYAEAEDDCSNVNLTYDDSPLQGACPQTFVRTWTAADACGNSAQCSQTITVIDDAPPVIICPADVNVSCGYVGAPPHITGLPDVSDQCSEVSFTYSDGPPMGECPKVFERTWIATDFCGNAAQCVQTISLFDNMPPVVTCPDDAVVQCTDDISPEVLGTATAVDFCNDVSVAYADSSVAGSCPETLLRKWTATDACGNTRSCTQTIMFADEALPEITCPEDVVLPCGADASPDVAGYATATAQCGSEALITWSDSLATTDGGGNGGGEIPGEGCGQLRTQTQGGWGSPASGNNPGAYRDANFDAAFPEGITLGCDYTLTLTSAAAVQAFLPSGGPASALTANLVNPTGYGNVLAGQLLAATLSVGFDANDPDFGASEVALGDMLIGSGAFQGYTVSEVLEAANLFFGGCETTSGGTELVRVLTAINESHVDGTGSSGFLDCPEDSDGDDGGEETGGCGTIYRTWTAEDGCGNAVTCVQVINFIPETSVTAEHSALAIEAYPSPTSGPVQVSLVEDQPLDGWLKVLSLQGQEVMARQLTNDAPSVQLDLTPLGRGFYIIQWQGLNGHGYAKIFKD